MHRGRLRNRASHSKSSRQSAPGLTISVEAMRSWREGQGRSSRESRRFQRRRNEDTFRSFSSRHGGGSPVGSVISESAMMFSTVTARRLISTLALRKYASTDRDFDCARHSAKIAGDATLVTRRVNTASSSPATGPVVPLTPRIRQFESRQIRVVLGLPFGPAQGPVRRESLQVPASVLRQTPIQGLFEAA